MLPLDGLMCVYYPHEIMYLSSFLLNLLNLEPNSLIIQLNSSEWTMSVNSHGKHLMIIICH